MRSGLLGVPWAAVIAGGFLVATTSIASASCNECDDISAWTRFTSIDLAATYAGHKGAQKWHAEFDPSTNDLRIDVDIDMGKEPSRGTIGMIAGRTMIVRGLKLERGTEIDALDGPMLSMRLLLALLNRTVPGGPDALKGPQKIDFSEPRVGIQFATPSAEGHITAPWRVVGTIDRPTPETVGFDLHLTGDTRDPLGRASDPIDMVFTGRLATRKAPVFQEGMSLAGWQVYGIGPKIIKKGGSTMLDYGASEDSAGAKGTVADVRAALEEEFSPGKLDSTKDFTGSWKEKCEQSFGLKIIHYGNEGKYAVLFCGPGGCDDPASKQPTFITGDKAYEVVSDDVLLSGRSSKQRYVRCSREVGDIRPVTQ
jgi:hypothetical protein